MDSWRPDERASRRERAELTGRCLSTVARGSLAESVELQHRLPASIDDLLWFDHPCLFLAYFGKTRNEAIPSIDDVLVEIDASKRRAEACRAQIGVACDLRGFLREDSPVIRQAIAYAGRINEATTSLRLVDVTDAQKSVIRDAFSIISSTWPEITAEISDFLKCLLFFQAKRVIGFVDFRIHGTVFLREDCLGSPLRLAEEVLHECSHIRLNTALAVDPIFSNSATERFCTPLRREPRPMFGLFHQMFVLARLDHFLNLRVEPEMVAKRPKVREQLGQAFAAVKSGAVLTPAGRKMVDTIEALLD